jgi:hypothetical protein
MTIVDYARERGPVAPFYTIIDGACNCPSGLKKRGLCHPGKHPVVKKTKGSKGGYYRATRDLKQVKQWFKKWPWANTGLGMEPGHRIAIDPDSRNGGDILLKALEGELGALPATWAIQSGSGDVRYVFQLPPDVSLGPIKVHREGMELEFIAGPGVGLMIGGVHGGNSTTLPGNPYIDLGGEIADLPKPWIEYLISLFSPLPPMTIVVRGGEGKKSAAWDLGDFDVIAAQWVWGRLRPGLSFPAPGQRVRCLVTDDKRYPNCGFIQTPQGYVRFHCFHTGESWAVTDLYAVYVLKIDRPKGGKALAKLRDRLYLVSGAVPRPAVRFDPPPEDLSDTEGRVYVDVIDALAENRVSFPGQPVMYTGGFGAKRLGLHRDAVYKALNKLEARGLIVPVGWVEAGLGYAKLWLTCAEVFQEKESSHEDLAPKCPCGCGETLPMRGGKPMKWAGPGCKMRVWRAKQEKREFASEVTADDVTWEEPAHVDW